MPTTDTLALLAPPLQMTLDQLVDGTEFKLRVDTKLNVVAKVHYEEAVRQIIVFEREANDLKDKLRRVEDALAEEQDRRRQAEAVLDAVRAEAQRHKEASARYEGALQEAVADVARLKTEVHELGKLVDDSRKTGRVAAILAGTAAAAATSVAAYLAAGAAKAKRKTRSKKRRERKV